MNALHCFCCEMFFFLELIMLIGSMFKQLACLHSSLCIFPLFEKLHFIKLDSFSTATRQIPIYRAPWISFLNRSYSIFDLSSFWTLSQQLLDPSRNFMSGQQILNRNLNPSRNFCRQQILDSTLTDSYLQRFSARQILDPSRCDFFKYLQREIKFTFSFLSQHKFFFYPSKHSPKQALILRYGLLNPLLSCISCIRPRFLGFL